LENNLKIPLEYFYKWEINKPNDTFLIQPIDGKYHYFTWKKVGDQARRISNYINSLNLKPNSQIAIISKNCAHWIITDLAIMMSGHTSVPLYANVNGKTAKYILEHSESKLVFIGKLEKYDWEEIKNNIPKSTVQVDFGYYGLNTKIKKWEDIIISTKPIKGSPLRKLNEIITIIYTSGTTGIPKGVVLKYSAAALATKNLNLLFPLVETDRFFSYLPLSHIAERALVEHGGIMSGGKIFFAETLDSFVKNLKFCEPTIFFGVPRIYAKFKSKLLSKFPQGLINTILIIPLLNIFFKNLIKKGLGLNKSRICITGAASTPITTLEWFDRFNIKIYEAYGMSENSACSHGNYPENIKFGTVGKAMPNTEVQITPIGEIIMKNGCIMEGYFKDQKKTNKVIKNGFLHTGDKGIIDKDGFLKITGRIKDIFKTSKGKYVSPNLIEMKLSKNKNIEQVCVVGENLNQPLALIILAEGIELNEEIEDSFKNLHTRINSELEKHEKINKIIILKDNWTIENEILTPTMKIKRNIVEKKYKESYDKWVSDKNEIIFQ
jgi:long-chain acyl-CoA synthetase